MITYAIIKKLSDSSTVLNLDENLYWEELPLQRDGKPAEGVWAVTRGGSAKATPRGLNQKTIIDFYIVNASKPKTEAEAEEIANWIRTNNGINSLSGQAGGVNYNYKNIRIWQTTTPQNQGATPNGSIVKMVSALVVFDIIK